MESIPEIDRIQKVAERLGKTASVSLRVNPDVDAKTHPYISTGLKANKFGIATPTRSKPTATPPAKATSKSSASTVTLVRN